MLAAWHAGARVLLLPNTARENIGWGETADIFLTDNLVHQRAWHLPECLAQAQRQPENGRQPENWSVPADAEAHLKTSGSSGKAQIIIKTAAQMQAEAQTLAAALPFGRNGEAVIGSVSPQHLYGFTFRFALALTMGWTMERAQAVYPENLLAATAAHRQAVWIASPAVLNRLGEGRDPRVLQKVAGIVSAGGALPEATANALAGCAVRPFEIYGSTETGVIASRRHQQTWQPFDGVSFGQDAEGALWADSPWSGGRFQTADLVERAPDGGFLLLGRKDRIIKFEDKRVSLTQIEHSLLQHEWIADAHCALHPQQRRIAVWAALNAAGIAALREHGRAAVADTLKRHLAAAQDNVFAGRVPLDLTYFGGHFASFPLVPGVVELQWARDLAARYPWGRQSVARVENLKYQQFIRPHDEVSVALQYDAGKNKLTFKITGNGKPCAAGRLVFAAA